VVQREEEAKKARRGKGIGGEEVDRLGGVNTEKGGGGGCAPKEIELAKRKKMKGRTYEQTGQPGVERATGGRTVQSTSTLSPLKPAKDGAKGWEFPEKKKKTTGEKNPSTRTSDRVRTLRKGREKTRSLGGTRDGKERTTIHGERIQSQLRFPEKRKTKVLLPSKRL